MALADVLGQERALTPLLHAFKSGRAAHGYLFHGPEGVGKAKAAWEFAKLLLCADPGDDSCGVCPSCRQIRARSHTDLHVLEPPEKRRYINVEQVRALIDRVNLHPMQGDHKAFIIRDADDLRTDAQNMMLKTLEEPPADSTLILVTARPHRLEPTIASRCQKVRFGRLTREQVRRILADNTDASEAELDFAAGYSGGSAGEGIRMIEADGMKVRDELLALMLDLKPGLEFEVADKLQSLYKPGAGVLEAQRAGMRFVLELATMIYRDAMLLAGGAEDAPLYNVDRRDDVKKLAETLGGARAHSAVERLMRARSDIDRNVNIRLNLAEALLDISSIQS